MLFGDPLDKNAEIWHVNHTGLCWTMLLGLLAPPLDYFQRETKQVELGPTLSSLYNYTTKVFNYGVSPKIRCRQFVRIVLCPDISLCCF